ncbi:MAG: DUF1934 domain-containing protein [Ruminococcus sp.]|jgi:uncharacterized beta-barrel protein YwiB (DUF1934 family)|nr:DUF1934 domain-containing protein [Ruminococcus sp.]
MKAYKKCTVTLKSIDAAAENIEEKIIETTADGKFNFFNDGSFHIKYIEIDKTDLSFTENNIRCNARNVIEISRKGEISSHMIIDIENQTAVNIKTIYGEFGFNVTAKEIKNNMTPQGGELIVRYNLDIDSKVISENEVRLNVKLIGD